MPHVHNFKLDILTMQYFWSILHLESKILDLDDILDVTNDSACCPFSMTNDEA